MADDRHIPIVDHQIEAALPSLTQQGGAMDYTRSIRRFGFVAAAAAAGLMIVEACSDKVSDMLVDAGMMLADAGIEAGQALMEAGTNIRDGQADGEAQSSNFKDGSRIKMRYELQTGADGSQYAAGPKPFDSMLNVECWPQLATDGKRRCIPNSPMHVSTYFADAQCTQLLGVLSADCAKPNYAIKSAISSCAMGTIEYSYAVFSVGAEFTGTYYQKYSSSCTAGAANPQVRFYRLVESPPANFVEFNHSGYATP